MPNTYFQFKQFRIDQENSAMKVCTDACIQGAYAVEWLKEGQGESAQGNCKILDIGTGTGLLTLMLAQALPGALIDAVERDEYAYRQAKENVRSTPWNASIRLMHGDIRSLPLDASYDFIICNPPFYENDLRSENELKSQAKHAVTLNYHDLSHLLHQYLEVTGSSCIMFPPQQFTKFTRIAAEKDMYPVRELQVRQSDAAGIFRVIGVFQKQKKLVEREDLAIRDGGNAYTESFTSLLKDYYLNF